MGIFEKTLGALAPGWAAARARDRLRLNAYEAASASRLHKAKNKASRRTPLYLLQVSPCGSRPGGLMKTTTW